MVSNALRSIHQWELSFGYTSDSSTQAWRIAHCLAPTPLLIKLV